MEKQAPLKNVEENMKGDASVPDGNAKAEGIGWESGEIKKSDGASPSISLLQFNSKNLKFLFQIDWLYNSIKRRIIEVR